MSISNSSISKTMDEIIERLDIPDELIPEDAHVEMEAKKAAGYYTSKSLKEGKDLDSVVGRKIEK